ncbi:hypothetical protein Mal48_35370 [Thalassoglobus polymorphus]|uniref:Uncharacterized protein n=1 Tax=Thalassoglobus polymorphus TaxID=2527994 RepID=A0A517QRN4_9PLAN|nr:hypothetical protein Mal48_35370 [Thalassoglobus polymorphus]
MRTMMFLIVPHLPEQDWAQPVIDLALIALKDDHRFIRQPSSCIGRKEPDLLH